MQKLFKLLLLLGALAFAVPSYSQAVAITVRPPRNMHEVRAASPHAGMVWQAGYQRWDAGSSAYVWTPGAWADPPHAHARWVSPRYVRTHGHWEFRDGRWK